MYSHLSNITYLSISQPSIRKHKPNQLNNPLLTSEKFSIKHKVINNHEHRKDVKKISSVRKNTYKINEHLDKLQRYHTPIRSNKSVDNIEHKHMNDGMLYNHKYHTKINLSARNIKQKYQVEEKWKLKKKNNF